MRCSLLTLFPDLYKPFLETSLIARAQEAGTITCLVSNMLDFCAPKERIDGPVFGHGAGMVIRPEVIERAITAREASAGKAFKIFFSPHGKKIDQDLLKGLAARIAHTGHLMLIAGRYEGMDARIEEVYADEILSVGDFVTMGGDLPAMLFLEAFLRLMPGVVGKSASVEKDSFWGPFVDHPAYTAPVVWHDREVPAVLRSGDHGKIAAWEQEQALERTVFGHFDWLRSHEVTSQERDAVARTIPPHYVALMHSDVLLPQAVVGTTSVTSLDIHDIARSAKSYGLRGYFIVTPLEDQQKIVKKLLHFWQEGVGISYNPHRHEALRAVAVRDSLDAVVQEIARVEGKEPLIVVTSAKPSDGAKRLTYFDQEKLWASRRPVLILLGTGHGLAPSVMERADYCLLPLKGYSDFNHLSVRSAAAVIFDRLLGQNIKR